MKASKRIKATALAVGLATLGMLGLGGQAHAWGTTMYMHAETLGYAGGAPNMDTCNENSSSFNYIQSLEEVPDFDLGALGTLVTWSYDDNLIYRACAQ